MYNYTIDKKHITVKMWIGTLKKLRMVYAFTGENMVAILDRLITAELERLQDARQNKES